MSHSKNKNNKFIFTATTTFGLIGFVLLVGTIFSHQYINDQFNFESKGVMTLEMETEDVLAEQISLPEEVLLEIIEDEKNIIGVSDLSKEQLSPSLKFLYTITRPYVFLTQK